MNLKLEATFSCICVSIFLLPAFSFLLVPNPNCENIRSCSTFKNSQLPMRIQRSRRLIKVSVLMSKADIQVQKQYAKSLTGRVCLSSVQNVRGDNLRFKCTFRIQAISRQVGMDRARGLPRAKQA